MQHIAHVTLERVWPPPPWLQTLKQRCSAVFLLLCAVVSVSVCTTILHAVSSSCSINMQYYLQRGLVDVIAGDDHKGRDAHGGAAGQAGALQRLRAEAEHLDLAADA